MKNIKNVDASVENVERFKISSVFEEEEKFKRRRKCAQFTQFA